ncbi:MAG: hypothetical protein NBV60_04955 [Erythrobacter sp.]|nr:hypothetical protein [Erythrobacter sp.]
MIARRAVLAGAAALAAVLAAPALAHQQKRAISTVAINPRSGAIEIMHQVPVHDAEHALRVQGAQSPDIIGSAESREAFARYVAQRFVLAVDGVVAVPAYVGSEITGGSLWVYQELPAARAGTPIRINSQILTDVWALQENRVNIGSGAGVTTLIFTAGDAAQDMLLAS